MKNYTLLLFLIFIGCENKNRNSEVHKEKQPVVSKDQLESEIKKVKIATQIEPFMKSSVSQHWKRDVWIKKFGSPLRDRSIGGGLEYLEYVELGPYPPSGRRLITGVVVTLKNGDTSECNWHYTEFGLHSDN